MGRSALVGVYDTPGLVVGDGQPSPSSNYFDAFAVWYDP
jgi:hypothetical protein